jgi:tRNA threonylcarbamoyladenosine biosynthesis protein TsaB
MRDVILGIETSHELGGVALAEGGACLEEVLSTDRFKHSEELILLVDRALKSSGLGLPDIGAVAVSIGPGSFTGLRVGLAAAKGLCLSREIPLVAVPTLDALASMVRHESVPTHAVIDARRGELYWASYESDGDVQKRTADYSALTPRDLMDHIKSESLVVGSGLDRYRDFILKNARVPIRFIEPNPRFPSPEEVSILGSHMLKAGAVVDTDSVEPIYIRPSDAETARGNKRA